MNVHLLPYSNKRSQKNFINIVTNYSINCRTGEIRKYHPNNTKDNSNDSHPIWGITISRT